MAIARATCVVCRSRKPTVKMKAVRYGRAGTLWTCSSCVEIAKEAFQKQFPIEVAIARATCPVCRSRKPTVKMNAGSVKARIAMTNLYLQMQPSSFLGKGPEPS